MVIVKRIFGIILTLIGIILVLSQMAMIPKLLNKISIVFSPNSGHSMGEAIGYILGFCLILTLIFFIFKYGILLIKTKNIIAERDDTID